MKTTPLSKRQLLLGLKYSTFDGAFSSVMLTLNVINGAFVIAFARKVLGMSEQLIGGLTALPFLVNILCSAVGLTVTLLAGFYLDLFRNVPEKLPLAFAALFTVAFLFRGVGLYYASRIPDPGTTESTGVRKMFRDLRTVVRDGNFM